MNEAKLLVFDVRRTTPQSENWILVFSSDERFNRIKRRGKFRFDFVLILVGYWHVLKLLEDSNIIRIRCQCVELGEVS